MKLLFRILDRILETAILITLASMSGVVAVNVFCRFVLNFSLSWGDEVAMMLMVWLTFLGAAVGMRDRANYAFDFLARLLPAGAKRPVRLFSELVCIAMTTGIIFWGTKVTIEFRNWIMPATEVSRALVYMACPIGCLFVLIYALRNFIRDFSGIQEPLEEKIITMEVAEEKSLI